LDFTRVTLRHGDDEIPNEGGAIVIREAPKPPSQTRRLLTLDVHDEIDPSTREWVTTDETGNAAMMNAEDVQAESLGAALNMARRQQLQFRPAPRAAPLKENIRANNADLTAFESWRFYIAPLSHYGGFERARAAFGSDEELEHILADMNRAVFDAPDPGDAAEPRPDKLRY